MKTSSIAFASLLLFWATSAASLTVARVARAENGPHPAPMRVPVVHAPVAPHGQAPVAPHGQAPVAPPHPAGAPANLAAHPAPVNHAAHGAEQAAPKPAFNFATTTAKNWAKARNLPTREVEVGPPERRVKRLFVPVKPEDWDSFFQTFGNSPRTMLLKLKSGDSHLYTAIDGDARLWARPLDHAGDLPHMANDGPTGPAIVVELTDAEASHTKLWFDHRKNPTDKLFQCGAACMDYLGNIEIAPAADGTNTLRPIGEPEIKNAAAAAPQGKGGMSAAVPGGRKLFDALGIARSKDGRNMTYNLVHAANERVQVIGIPLGSDGATRQEVVVENGRRVVKRVAVDTGDPVERFLKMTDAELLGPLPPQGVAAVVRPSK